MASASPSSPAGPWHTWYTLLFVRWCGRKLWTRRMALAVLCLASVLTLYYQWENWRSARELAEARLRLIERAGTDDLLQLAPPKVPDDQNYFAIPLIESWSRLRKPGSLVRIYRVPQTALGKPLPLPEIKEAGPGLGSRLDLPAWAAERLKAGKPVSGDEPLARTLDRELGDAGGLLPRLAEGLNRPFSEIKPGRREALEAAENPLEAALPQFNNLNELLRYLALHLRAAARAGNVAKTAATAQIMLRLSEGPAHHGLVGYLVTLAAYGITMDALHEALSCPEAWTEEGLVRLQQRLSETDELKLNERALLSEVLSGYRIMLYYRSLQQQGRPGILACVEARWTGTVPDATKARLTSLLEQMPPDGWYDATIAFYIENMLQIIGPAGDTAWLHAGTASAAVASRLRSNSVRMNPRHAIVGLMVPMIGNVHEAAGEALFRRRCAMIAIQLERYRRMQGGYPASLEALGPDLDRFPVRDPARPDQPMGYRNEGQGYLLWSAGKDTLDDGGTTDKDWLWRMKREGQN